MLMPSGLLYADAEWDFCMLRRSGLLYVEAGWIAVCLR